MPAILRRCIRSTWFALRLAAAAKGGFVTAYLLTAITLGPAL